MRRGYLWLAVVAIVLPTVSGCLAGIGKRPESLLLVGQPDMPGLKAPSELPPNETARVCIVAADNLFKAGKDHEAILLYEKARETDPRSVHVSRRLAVLYDRKGQHQKSRDEYERALTLLPNDADLLNDLGYSCFSRGQLDEAELHLSKAVAANSKHKRAWVNLGLVLGQKERYRDSLNAFEQAVSRGQAYSNLGFIYTTQGKKAEAIQAYRQALKVEPDMPLTQAALARLEGGAGLPAPKRLGELEAGTLKGGTEVSKPARAEPVPQTKAPAAKLEPVRAIPAAGHERRAVSVPPRPMRGS